MQTDTDIVQYIGDIELLPPCYDDYIPIPYHYTMHHSAPCLLHCDLSCNPFALQSFADEVQDSCCMNSRAYSIE